MVVYGLHIKGWQGECSQFLGSLKLFLGSLKTLDKNKIMPIFVGKNWKSVEHFSKRDMGGGGGYRLPEDWAFPNICHWRVAKRMQRNIGVTKIKRLSNQAGVYGTVCVDVFFCFPFFNRIRT